MFKNQPGKLRDYDIKAWVGPTNQQVCFTVEEVVEAINEGVFLQMNKNLKSRRKHLW